MLQTVLDVHYLKNLNVLNRGYAIVDYVHITFNAQELDVSGKSKAPQYVVNRAIDNKLMTKSPPYFS